MSLPPIVDALPASDDRIEILDAALVDHHRERTVPVRIYLPRGQDRLPLILFSPGLGNSRAGYSYLGRGWAGEGYAVIFLSHPDSDDTLSLRELYGAAFDQSVWKNRPLDVTFVLDQLHGRADPSLAAVASRIDLDRVAVAGHSYGAYTALALAGGLVLLDGERVSLADPRFRAVALLSPPRMRAISSVAAYAPIRLPVLHLTGTRDNSIVFATPPRVRRVPFESIANAEQFLVTFAGARHGSFSDRGFPRDPERHHAGIAAFTTAFFDFYLKADSTALGRMDQLASDGTKLQRKFPPE